MTMVWCTAAICFAICMRGAAADKEKGAAFAFFVLALVCLTIAASWTHGAR